MAWSQESTAGDQDLMGALLQEAFEKKLILLEDSDPEDQEEELADELAAHEHSTSANKTATALLFQMCEKFKFQVPMFDLVSNVGDPQSKVFYMSVTIPDMNLQVVGIGNTKKKAKHDAAMRAMAMVVEAAHEGRSLHEVPPNAVLDCSNMLKQASFIVYPFENRSKAQHAADHLRKWAQGNKQLLPTYYLRGESGPDHSKKFVVECQQGGHSTLGEGNSKKTAKNMAASRMMDLLGIPF